MKRLITRLALGCLLCLPVLAASRIYIHTNDADWDGYIHAAIVRMKVAAIVTEDIADADYILESTVKPALGPLAPPPRVHYEPGTVSIFNGPIVVPASGYTWVKFMTGNQADQKLTVSFTATGGTGNDIDVAVMSSAEMPNWTNRHPTQLLYHTGKLTTGRFAVTDFNAGATEYVVFFDNRFSLVTPKVVTAQVDFSNSVKVFDDPDPNGEKKMLPGAQLMDARTNESLLLWLWTDLPTTGATPSWFQSSAERIVNNLKQFFEKRLR